MQISIKQASFQNYKRIFNKVMKYKINIQKLIALCLTITSTIASHKRGSFPPLVHTPYNLYSTK